VSAKKVTYFSRTSRKYALKKYVDQSSKRDRKLTGEFDWQVC
jgi:hypothetical protein